MKDTTMIEKIIDDMTEQEKENYNYLMGHDDNYPNIREMIDDFWACYYHARKSPIYEHGYL
jgi:hypothetical protein|tara:strand:- start:1559 stop:1741 length:183 start_codon:yes stop_codon:yes gene_type:complete